jgi:hypothetical protein
VFDSETQYETISVLEHHTQTITSLKFNQVHKLQRNELFQELSLLSTSADKSLKVSPIDLKATKDNFFGDAVTKQFKNKVFSMDVAEQAQFMVIG